MKAQVLSALSPLDRVLLRWSLRVVPEDDRSNWLRCWQAELWHGHYPRCGGPQRTADLYSGLLCDAFWLRAES